MEANRSHLIAAIRPYLHFFSIFTITPPIACFQISLRRSWFSNSVAGYAFYSLIILLIVMYECYINIDALQLEVEDFKAVDFTLFMGKVQKILIVLIMVCNHLNMWTQFRRLKSIFKDIADLDNEIDKAMKQFGGQVPLKKFRWRVGLGVGWWMCFCVVAIPYLTHIAIGPYVKWPDKVLTQFILVIIQLKGQEFCVFVILISEFIRRLRHSLEKILEELVDCEEPENLQELCVALRQNQTLVGRVWHLVEEISGYFSLPLIFLFLYNGLTILHVVNWAFVKHILPNDKTKYCM
ncbi:putative gustatory receptor 98d [Drosophila ananassae]|uniref:putative gustatory receptor 98d n=1 Tax=Drosophila ananassae TaxID=7217 RepID=UPI001CFF70AF|nr:putative gustatory receptor 98d [Drosophila ananassae]